MSTATGATLRAFKAYPIHLGGVFRPTMTGLSNIRLVQLTNQSKASNFLENRRSYVQTVSTLQEAVPITYVNPDGSEVSVEAKIGHNLMDVAHENNIELEGACGGELACSTCHLVFEKDIYDSLPEKEEEEDDMLDLAFEVTETSRLGCQILVKEEFAGMKVRIPDDGFGS